MIDIIPLAPGEVEKFTFEQVKAGLAAGILTVSGQRQDLIPAITTHLIWAAENNRADLIPQCMRGCIPSHDPKVALRIAANLGHAGVVGVIAREYPSAISYAALIFAQDNDYAALRILANHATQEDWKDVLSAAAGLGHVAAVKEAILHLEPPSRSQPARRKYAPDDDALFLAAKAGHLEVIDLILTISVDPSTVLASHSAEITPPAFARIQAYLDDQELRKSIGSSDPLIDATVDNAIPATPSPSSKPPI